MPSCLARDFYFLVRLWPGTGEAGASLLAVSASECANSTRVGRRTLSGIPLSDGYLFRPRLG